MRQLVITLFVLSSLVLVGCEQVDLDQLSDEDIQGISDQVIVCESPYIRHGAGCCLDENQNTLCDKEESLSEEENPTEERPDNSDSSSDDDPEKLESSADDADELVEPLAPETPETPESAPDETGLEKPLRSAYFSSDIEAQEFAAADTSFIFPEENSYFQFSFEDDLSWRVVNAFQYAGYEEAGLPWGQEFTSQDLIVLDSEVIGAEEYVQDSAKRLSFYHEVSGPDFKDNLPQEFAASTIASIMELYNAGPTTYFTFTEDCMWASFIPQMCGALVDMGTGGSGSCKDASSTIVEPLIIQTPELFGFNNVRREITAEEYPKIPLASTFAYASTLTHEFAHDLQSIGQERMSKAYPRTLCTGKIMDQSEGPFSLREFLPSEDDSDYVSQYAKTNVGEDYAESITAYILLPEYFRQRADNSEILQQKYDRIKTAYFGGVEFETAYLSEDVQYSFPDKVGEFAQENSLERFSFADISSYSDAAIIGQCLIPSCAEPKDGCHYEESDELDEEGCPVYPCGVEVCEEVLEPPYIDVLFSQSGESIEKMLQEDQSVSFSLLGTSYTASILVLSESSKEAKLLIKGEITQSLGIGDSQTIHGIRVTLTEFVT